MTTVPSSRAPRADSERNRRRVVDAATQVFAERGPDATLGDIARAAGVGIGTVYRKFADKDAVLDVLVEEKIDALVASAEEAALVPDAGSSIRGLLFAVMQQRATDRGLDAVLRSPSRAALFAEELGRRFLPVVDRLVARAVEAGELRPEVSGQEICVLAFLVGKVADITRHDDPELWRRYAQLLLDGTRVAAAGAPLAPAPLSFESAIRALGRAT